MWKPAGLRRFIHDPPHPEELKKMTIAELITLSMHKVRREKPFKAALIAYLQSLGKLE